MAARRRGPRGGERLGRRGRRDPDSARAGAGAEKARLKPLRGFLGAGAGAERARLNRLGGFQRAVDRALHALSDNAGRRGTGRAAGRHPARRTQTRRRQAARCRSVGRARPNGTMTGGRAMSDTVRRPNRLSAAEAIAQLSSGALTAEALTRACLDRAAERASVKAWKWLDPEYALAQAREADRAGRPGLLSGLPIGVKDIIDTADMPTEHG